MAQPTSLRRARRERRARAKPSASPRREPLFQPGGRAWINGSEVGGTDPRYAHLDRSYD